MASEFILPGATLGVVGGGQLGRMFCVAARTMGYRVAVLDPDPDCGAGQVADIFIQAQYTDKASLEMLAEQCDAVTLEFENIPSASVRIISEKSQMFPGADALGIAQNRDAEKKFASTAGLQPVPYHAIDSESDLEAAADVTGFPAILKSNTLGYDGKGQYQINDVRELSEAYQAAGKVSCVLEKKISIQCEVSVIVARNAHSQISTFPVSENLHRNGILHMCMVPARVTEALSRQAIDYATTLAESLSYVGVLAVEFFVSDDDRLYFNEMAPRPHNSGHYTEDACATSQYEQLVRVMCGLPPGDTRLLSPVVMVNMLGELWPPDWTKILAESNAKLHLYGKREARDGRKMAHFNILSEDVEQALVIAEKVFASLSG